MADETKRGGHTREKDRVVHAGPFQPGDWPRFVELPTFSRAWAVNGLSDGELRELQLTLIENPLAAPVVSGTGGLRKIRFASRHGSGGKSGGVRVCYAVYPDYSVIVLAMVYSKRDKADLTPAERRDFREILARFGRLLVQGKF